MAAQLRQEMTPCRHCGFSDISEGGNFRKEERLAFREVGDRASHNYSRETFKLQYVLACVSCGRVQEILDRP